MQRDATEEHRLAVEQDVGAAGRQRAEADPVAHPIGPRPEGDVVELRGLGRPERDAGREGERRPAGGVGGDGLRDAMDPLMKR